MSTQELYDSHNAILTMGTEAEAHEAMQALIGRVVGHFESIVNDLFLLGAAAARAQVLAYHRQDYIGSLSTQTGIAERVLKRALELYRTFGGSLKEYIEWKASWVERNDVLLIGHVDELIRLNKERRDLSKCVDEYNEHITGSNERCEREGRPAAHQPASFRELAADRPLVEPLPSGKRVTAKDQKRQARARTFAALRSLVDEINENPIVEKEIELPDGRKAVVTLALVAPHLLTAEEAA